MKKIDIADLRSRKWFMNPDNPEMTALYLERYLNYGLTRQELQSGKPIIGIAQTGSDLSPCNRHHIELTKRVRDGILAAGASYSGNWQAPDGDAGSQSGLSVAG
jgi:dihydroxy-acid dehydratase